MAREEWDVEEVLKHCTIDEMRQVISEGMMIQRGNILKPSYLVAGTPTYNIVEYVSNEIFVFSELLRRLPKISKCDATKLKDLLSFLVNFNQVQLFNLPASGLTIVTGDSEEQDIALDWIFSLSDETEV